MNTLPITYKLMIAKFLPKGHLNVLDLGCGKGTAGEIFNKAKKHSFTGVDIFVPYLNLVKRGGFYEKVVTSDLVTYKIPRNKYDVILIFQVLEHLNKNAALKIIKASVAAAKQAVIITLPNGECEQGEYDKNPHQRHKSSWVPRDFAELGFSVYGQGLGFVYQGKSYATSGSINFWQKISAFLSLLLAPVVFLVPSWGAQLICVKYTKP